MTPIFTPRDEDGRRRFVPRHLVWIVPLGLVVAAGVFLGLGTLVAWLWRVTLVDIFAIKPISFWQAWGLILLAQILFKANLQPTTSTGRRRHRGAVCGDPSGMHPEPPPLGREG